MKIPETPPDTADIMGSEEARLKFAEYAARQDVNELIRKANDEYLYWEEMKYRPVPKDADLRVLWAMIKFNRNSSSKKISLDAAGAGGTDAARLTFGYNVPARLLHKLHKLDAELIGKTNIPLAAGAAGGGRGQDKERFLINSIMEEAIASSQLEGAVTTRAAARAMLENGRKPQDRSERMIFNNYRTIKRLSASKDEPLAIGMVLDIHESMTEGTLSDEKFGGRFRESNDVEVVDNVTGEVCYRPPHFNLLPDLMAAFCEFANEDEAKSGAHPLIKASVLHFLIGYIHPFVDGNGRTARAVFYWYLLRRGYWLAEFMSISRAIIDSPAQYARAYLYAEKDENDMTYFIDYQLKVLGAALDGLKQYLKEAADSEGAALKLLGEGGGLAKGLNVRQAKILQAFAGDPSRAMTIREAESEFGVVYQTARTDLLALEKMGFLKKMKIKEKKLAFFAGGKLGRMLNKKKNNKKKN